MDLDLSPYNIEIGDTIDLVNKLNDAINALQGAVNASVIAAANGYTRQGFHDASGADPTAVDGGIWVISVAGTVDGTIVSPGDLVVSDGVDFEKLNLGKDGTLVAANNLSDLDNAATARTNLGLAIGSDVQAYSALLAALAGITPTDGVIPVGDGSTFVGESGATLRSSLGLGTSDTRQFAALGIGLAQANANLEVQSPSNGQAIRSAGRASDNLNLWLAYANDNATFYGQNYWSATEARKQLGQSGQIFSWYDSAAAEVMRLHPSNGLSLDSGSNYLLTPGGNVQPSAFLNFPDSGNQQISAGAITVTGSNHRVDTESLAATDDLDTINGGTTGDILIIRAASSSRTVVCKDSTGNLFLAGDFSLSSTTARLALIAVSTTWVELFRSSP